MELDTDAEEIINDLPAGSISRTFTVTGTSTAGLNSTVQVKVTSDPTGRMGLTGLLVTVTKVGTGTGMVHTMSC